MVNTVIKVGKEKYYEEREAMSNSLENKQERPRKNMICSDTASNKVWVNVI